MSLRRSSRIKAVGVEAADVAGADEALALGVEPLGLARRPRAGCGSRSSCRASGRRPRRWSRRPPRPARRSGACRCPRRRPARRCAVCRGWAPPGCRCRRLRSCRRTPPARRASAPARRPSAPPKRHAGAELHAEGGQVRRSNSGTRHQARWYCTGTSMVCVARYFSRFQVTARVERDQHHQRRRRPASGRTPPAWCWVQRRGQQRHAVRPVVVQGAAARCMRPAHAVRLHDALGLARWCPDE